jgi:hypothetical protein
MPIALTTPIAGAPITSVDVVRVNIEVSTSTVALMYVQTDNTGATSTGSASMTLAAFGAAFAAATGTLKQKLCEVLQSAVPAFAGTVS